MAGGASPGGFVELLQKLPRRPHVFNPWRDRDRRNDGRVDAPEVRARQLEAYLAARQRSARLLLVAEAVGYQGAKFSGVPLTTERMLLGHVAGVPAQCAFDGPGLQTSRPAVHPRGVTEPTSTIAWKQLLALGWQPREFVFWNAFPLHPHRAGEPLSNRPPTRAELAASAHVLDALRALFPRARTVAVGRVASEMIAALEGGVPRVRHPANGGAVQFRRELAALLQ